MGLVGGDHEGRGLARGEQRLGAWTCLVLLLALVQLLPGGGSQSMIALSVRP
jgi:hypothetical protein